MSRRRTKKKRAAAPPEPEPTPAPTAEPEPLERVPTGPKLLAALFGIAFVIRILFLGRADLYGSEILFVQSVASTQTPWEVFASYWERFLTTGQLPLVAVLHNVYLWCVSSFFEDPLNHPALQRLPFVFWGSLAVPIFYLLCVRLVQKRVALGAALLLACSFFPVYYAREALQYAPLVFLSTAALYLLIVALDEGGLTKQRTWLLYGALAATALTDRHGVILPLVLLVLTTIALSLNRYPFDREPEQDRALTVRVLFASLGAVGTVAPFFMNRLLNATPPTSPAQTGLPAIFADATGKLFMGTTWLALLLTWVFLVGGVIYLWRATHRRSLKRTFLLTVVLCFLAILVVSMNGNYLAHRFHLILAPFYLVIACGIEWAVAKALDLLKRDEVLAPKGAVLVLVLILLVQLLIFVPKCYALEAKGLDFGAIAEWLVKNRPEGTPYVFESGYDHRFVPGAFPTPGLISAVPYIHGAGPEETQRLHAAQRAFFARFPEACFIEPARRPGNKAPVWEWPKRFFRQVSTIENEVVQDMVRLGIAPTMPRGADSDQVLVTSVRYNTPADQIAIWRDAGQPLFYHFDQWQIRRMNQNTYGRAAPGPQRPIRIENLTGLPMKGAFTLTGGFGGAEQNYDVEIRFNGELISQVQRWPGQLWSVQTDPVEIGPGQHELVWGMTGETAAGVEALMLTGIDFGPVRESDEEAP